MLIKLLRRLLDLRLDKDEFADLNTLKQKDRLTLELLFCLPYRSIDESLEPLVKAKIDQLVESSDLSMKQPLKILLELAQLYGWMAYRCRWLSTQTQDEGSVFLKEGLFYSEACIKSLLRLRQLSKWKWLFKRKLMRQMHFLIQAMKLEMKEVKLPQKIIEEVILEDGHVQTLEKKMIERLQQNQLTEAFILSKQLFKYQPYRLHLQIIQATVQQAYRLQLTFQALLKPSWMQSISYRYHLIDRADRSIKSFCSRLRLMARYPDLSLETLNALGSLASENWSQLIGLYEEEYQRKNPSDPSYWRLWLQSQILNLGSILGGAYSLDQPLSRLDPEMLKINLQSLNSLESRFSGLIIKFLVTLIVLVNQCLEDKREVESSMIEALNEQLRGLQSVCKDSSLKKKLGDHAMDLHLLYHRDQRAGPFELLRISACLLAIYPHSSEDEVLKHGLMLLEGFYDLWSGASFQ